MFAGNKKAFTFAAANDSEVHLSDLLGGRWRVIFFWEGKRKPKAWRKRKKLVLLFGLKLFRKNAKKFWQNKKSCYLCRPENRETVPAGAQDDKEREKAGYIGWKKIKNQHWFFRKKRRGADFLWEDKKRRVL